MSQIVFYLKPTLEGLSKWQDSPNLFLAAWLKIAFEVDFNNRQ